MSKDSAEDLHKQFRLIREKSNFSEDHRIRIHRAISWLKCAENYYDSDGDLAVIALWISFNSCYSIDAENKSPTPEKLKVKHLIEKLISHDNEKLIHGLLFEKYLEEVKRLINNKYIFGPFWKAQKDSTVDWMASFTIARRVARRSLEQGKTELLLSIIIDRLYVLRNQLIHGGATYQGAVNREQIEDAKGLLIELIPIIIKTMFSKEDWGEITYPVVS